MSFDERTAIVTGAANGIGFASARDLAAQGARVVAIDCDAESLERAWARLPGQSSKPHLPLTLDVRDADAVRRVVDEALDACGGRINILVNSAGIAGKSCPSWDVDDAEWQRVLGVNLSGTFHMIRAVLPTMRSQGYGRIVNLASIAGKEGNPSAAPYSASKAGVIGLTKSVAKEVATDGILVNCVTPALISTPMNEQVSAQHLEYMMARIPMRRAGEPDEVAALVTWLCSDLCSFSTGAVFDISGGRATY